MSKEEIFKQALIKSIPIMCSYLFVSMAYGMMMEEAGFHWYYSLLISMTVYTGAFQFVFITFLSSGASLLTVTLTALLMNSRQVFYSLTFVSDFQQMGKRLPYMIHTMTDETYAINCTLVKDIPQRSAGNHTKGESERWDCALGSEESMVQRVHDMMFYVAFLSRCYWMAGAVIGGVLGQVIPFDFAGIDFCMTALFVIIFMDQWEKEKKHYPALAGLAVAVVCLFLFGQSSFMLPALLLVSALLLITERKEIYE